MRRHLAVIAGAEPSEGLAINPDLPADFITSADAGSRALSLLADGEFGLDGDKWVFIGRAETEATRQAALTALAAVPALVLGDDRSPAGHRAGGKNAVRTPGQGHNLW